MFIPGGWVRQTNVLSLEHSIDIRFVLDGPKLSHTSSLYIKRTIALTALLTPEACNVCL